MSIGKRTIHGHQAQRRVCRVSVWSNLRSVRLVAVAALIVGSGTEQAMAVSVTVGGVTIVDGAPLDTNQAANVINFDSTAPPPAGFAVPQGYHVAGTVDLLPVLLGGAGIRLTEFTCTSPAGAAGGVMPVSFTHTFAAPPAPVWGVDGIDGSGLNLTGPIGGIVVKDWQGFVNTAGITPPPGGISWAFGGTVPNPYPFAGAHGPKFFAGGGPPWVLRGDFEVTLSILGDSVSLPASAEVVILPDEIPDTPTGVCCLYESACQDEIPQQLCEALNGSFDGEGTVCLGDNNSNGIDDACEEEIPTVSEWGLIVFTLLVLTVATVALGRRRRRQRVGA